MNFLDEDCKRLPYHRFACRHRFDGRHAEIFIDRKVKGCKRALIIVSASTLLCIAINLGKLALL